MSRSKWEHRAAKLRDDNKPWKVGRTDMQTYLASTGEPVHYAYGPNQECILFVCDEHGDALEKAVIYCESFNALAERVNTSLFEAIA
jgi:hypothetical protein